MLRLPVRVPVAVGMKMTPTWQVFEVSGLEVEQVVVAGQQNVREGSPVKVVGGGL